VAKTYEALLKAEQEKVIPPEEVTVFDTNSQAKPHFLVSFKSVPQITEEYHRMRQSLLSASPLHSTKALLFASATKGEGTSTVITNFAITLATAGDKVLLVDANHRNPSLHELLSVEKNSGLTELLLDNKSVEELIKKTTFNNLCIITSGTHLSNPSSLFESKQFDNFITQMKAQADWILFDAPPINIYNDASTLAAKVDGIILVVEAEKTRWEVAQNAKERLENGKIKILGAILNRRKMHIPEWAYKML